MAKRSLDPRVAYPDVKLQVRVVGIVAPFSPRGSVPGEIPFNRDPVGAASSGMPRESKTNFKDWTVDCCRVLWVPGPRGQ